MDYIHIINFISAYKTMSDLLYHNKIVTVKVNLIKYIIIYMKGKYYTIVNNL